MLTLVMMKSFPFMNSIAGYRGSNPFSNPNVTQDLDSENGNANSKPNLGLHFRFKEALNVR